MVRELDNQELENTQRFLVDEVRQRASKDENVKKLLDGLALLNENDEDMLKNNIVMSRENWDEVRERIKMEFRKSHGIEENFLDESEKQRESRENKDSEEKEKFMSSLNRRGVWGG